MDTKYLTLKSTKLITNFKKQRLKTERLSGKHLYSLTRLILGGGNPVASLEGKIASKMGFVSHEPGAVRQEVEGMGPLRGILESLSHVLMPQGK